MSNWNFNNWQCWLTGSVDFTEDGEYIEGTDKLYLNMLNNKTKEKIKYLCVLEEQ